ncbi:MAG: lipopolysaccharide biosynthesis protein [Bryobacteraceae bacterium]|nr:lipopolysaccharide biosynthesis protein [Bryobacteraceae bacterium]
MQTRTCQSQATSEAAPSLRSNFAWTFAGNSIYGACQWGVMSLIAKLGSGEMLGEYALALALVMPVAMLSHLNLRAVLATDIFRRHPFGDYQTVRLWVSAAAMAVIVMMALASGRGATIAFSMVLIGFSLTADIVSDVYYGAMLRRERMAEIAWSLIARGLLALVSFGVVLAATRSLLPSVAMLLLARLAVLWFFDRPRGSQGEDLAQQGRESQWEIFRTALPLGVVLMLVSFTSSVPRYAVEHFLGTRELGVFAAVAAFLTAGSTVVNALGQSATPRLARHFGQHEDRQFVGLALKLAGLAAALGVVGVVLAAVVGGWVMGTLYRAEYSVYGPLLTQMMVAAGLVYVASALGYVITSARSFLAQMPLLAVVAATSALTSWSLIPGWGLRGAALAVAVTASIQIAGELLILSKAMRRMERVR